MNIFIICSKHHYPKIAPIQEELHARGHTTVLPNSYTNPGAEAEQRAKGAEVHAEWKADMLQRSIDVIADVDAVLVLNFEKNGVLNYIGGATFLEMYEAFRQHKAVYLYNPVPEGILYDEILAFHPTVLSGDLTLIKK